MEDFIFLEKKFNKMEREKQKGLWRTFPVAKFQYNLEKKNRFKGVGVNRLSLQDNMEEVPLYAQQEIPWDIRTFK